MERLEVGNTMDSRQNETYGDDQQDEVPVVIYKQHSRRSFPFRVGTLTVSVCSVLLIALMSVLYLNQLGQADKANQALQQIQNQRTTLARQQQDLQATIAQEQLPTYVAAHASQQGLVPPDWRDVRVIKVQGLQPVPDAISIQSGDWMK
jgi:hypothetical protein